MVDFLDGVGFRREDFFPFLLDGGAEFFEVENVAVDEGVKEGVAELVEAEGADAGFPLADALSHVIEAVVVGFLESE